MLPDLNSLSPSKLEFITRKDLFLDHYLQCMHCKYVDKGLGLMRTNKPCPKCQETGSRRYFPANNRMLVVYHELIDSYFTLYDTKNKNEEKVKTQIMKKFNDLTDSDVDQLVEDFQKSNLFQFAEKYAEQLDKEPEKLMHLHMQFSKMLELPKLHYSYVIIHSLTLLEMYLSYLIQSILIRKKTNIKVVIHIIENIRSFNGYFRCIKNISKITWKKDIQPGLFKNLPSRFENINKIRNNFVHHGIFVQNIEIVDSAITMASRLLPVFVDVHNKYLVGEEQESWGDLYI